MCQGSWPPNQRGPFQIPAKRRARKGGIGGAVEYGGRGVGGGGSRAVCLCEMMSALCVRVHHAGRRVDGLMARSALHQQFKGYLGFDLKRRQGCIRRVVCVPQFVVEILNHLAVGVVWCGRYLLSFRMRAKSMKVSGIEPFRARASVSRGRISRPPEIPRKPLRTM
jgi:hypothetical protein